VTISPQTLAWLRQSAKFDGATTAQVLLHLLERVEVLDQKYETQRLATLEWGKDVDKLMRWIDDHLKRIMALEQRPTCAESAQVDPTPEAAPVATGKELRQIWEGAGYVEDALRAIYNLGRQHGATQPPAAQPTPPAAPAGGVQP